MGAFVAGWDGGGTKTKVVCLSLKNTLIGESSFGPLNPNGASVAEVCRTVSGALQWMESLGTCTALAVSTAGISNPEVSSLLTRLLSENGYHEKLKLMGDQESALFGAVGSIGAVLVAGTGSICFGRSSLQQTARAGGYGYLVDDEGSGYAIGRDILAAVLRASDGRIPPTRLTGLLNAKKNWSDIPAMMRNLYRDTLEKAEIAALAPLAIEAGEDEAARLILEKATRELTLLASTVIERLGLQGDRLALTGSILEKMLPVRNAVIESLTQRYPRLQGFHPLASAAYGAAQMALQLIGKDCEPHA